jgi:hypothetical protein
MQTKPSLASRLSIASKPLAAYIRPVSLTM